MQTARTAPQRLKRIHGWLGAACWLLILFAKRARGFELDIDPRLIDVAPSLLGPAGLLLVILSSERRFARLTIARAAALSGAIALGVEFAQLLPLVRRIYRFDWLDVAATLLSLCAGVLVSAALRRWYRIVGR